MFAAPLVLQDLGMGTYAAPTVGKNFVALTASALTGTNNASAQVALAVAPAVASANAGTGVSTTLDTVTADLSADGWARNACVVLALAASTPVTVDLTDIAAQTVWAGDRSFTLVNDLVLVSLSGGAVTVSPGASNPWSGPLGGTAPTFALPASGRQRWHSPAGWAVTLAARTLKFDPGGAAATVALCVGGSY